MPSSTDPSMDPSIQPNRANSAQCRTCVGGGWRRVGRIDVYTEKRWKRDSPPTQSTKARPAYPFSSACAQSAPHLQIEVRLRIDEHPQTLQLVILRSTKHLQNRNIPPIDPLHEPLHEPLQQPVHAVPHPPMHLIHRCIHPMYRERNIKHKTNRTARILLPAPPCLTMSSIGSKPSSNAFLNLVASPSSNASPASFRRISSRRLTSDANPASVVPTEP